MWQQCCHSFLPKCNQHWSPNFSSVPIKYFLFNNVVGSRPTRKRIDDNPKAKQFDVDFCRNLVGYQPVCLHAYVLTGREKESSTVAKMIITSLIVFNGSDPLNLCQTRMRS